MTMLRSGFASNESGPTFLMPPGKTRKPEFSDEFLERQGAAKYSTILMTPTGYLTDETWVVIVPLLAKGLRHVVEKKAASFGIDAATAAKLLIGLLFDGCIIHLKNLAELLHMADNNVLALNEGRDSSAINQAFDRFVARAGKRRAAITLDQIRRSHINPVIDGWMLVLVGLQMLRDCSASRVWENSFVAVNLHPHHRISLEDWLQKIGHFVEAAEKFEEEVIDEYELLPAEWKKTPLPLRQSWLKIIQEESPVPSWDVDLLGRLRDADMPLSIAAHIYKIYKVEQRLRSQPQPGKPKHVTPPKAKKKPVVDKNTMIYHLFNVSVPGMTKLDRFHHAVTVRNRQFGPGLATTPSSYLDLQISDDNKTMLTLTPEDVNMHKVLQMSTCKHGQRRRVAKRCLNALGGVSGLCSFLNDEEHVAEIKSNLKFAQSLEEVRAAEKQLREDKAKSVRQKYYAQARAKCGLGPKDDFYKHHVKLMTCAQLKAVCFIECGGLIINGKAAELKMKLTSLLDEDVPGVPEYPTQDEVFSCGSEEERDDDEGSVTVSMDISFAKMPECVDECVEVWWKGDKCWYEGRLTAVDTEARTFDIYYFLDKQTLTHNEDEYKVRQAC